MQVKPPGVAGHFYPDEPAALTAEVERWLAGAAPFAHRPKAIIAPHAGYGYSGAIAGSAYAPIARDGSAIERVVLLGPTHRVAVKGLALTQADFFATPLGDIPVDWPWTSRILGIPGVQIADAAFAREHSLEVQLPFLQRTLGRFSLVPILVGAAPPELVDRVLATLWGGPETLIVVSSDLSHFHNYDTALKLDTGAAQAIETLRPDRLGEEQACGRHAIRGLLSRARGLDMRVTTMDMRNSGDTAGSKDRVVGYGAWAFEYGAEARLDAHQRQILLRAADTAIRFHIKHGRPPQIRLARPDRGLTACRAVFVTLESGDKLRGCIGSMEPTRSLIDDVVENACKAAFGDPRFPPLTEGELDRLHVSVSILGPRQSMTFNSEADLVGRLRPDIDGVIIQDGNHRGVFLPQVWDKLPEAATFLRHLKAKAGLPQDHWSAQLKAWRFTTESFGDSIARLTANMDAAPPA